MTMEEQVQKILNQFSFEEIEKLKRLLSIIPDTVPLVNVGKPIEVVTLRVFSDEYSHHIKLNRSHAYHSSVLLSLKHFIDFFGDQKLMHSIGLKDIENFISHLQHQVPKGYRVYIKTLKAAINKAIDWDYVKENYFLKIKLPKKQQIYPAYLNESQLAAICEKIENKIIKDIVTVAFYTGMRLNEIINLTWWNVNLETKIITVGDENFTTKGRNQRYIPICDEIFEVLSKRIPKVHKIDSHKSYVFCKSNGLPFTGDFISRSFKCACSAAGIDQSIHFHSLRHSFASNLVQKGVSLYTVKELLGHSSISTTEIYSHLNMDSLKEAIKTFDGPISPNKIGSNTKSLSFVRLGAFQNETLDNKEIGG